MPHIFREKSLFCKSAVNKSMIFIDVDVIVHVGF